MTISPLVIFFASIFTSNMIFSNFLGMCSFIAVSKEIETATGLGIAVTFVLTITTIINFFLYKLVVRFNIEYLRYIIFIISIAAFVQLLEMILEKYVPNLYYALGIFLPLITVNCAILGVSLFMVIRNYNFLQTVGFAIGSGLGWMLAIVSMAGIRSKIKDSSVPKGLQGSPLTLIITGIMAMAFIGFSGIVQIS
ncbi:NADH:ubiquinone reductase (Na(+)-transporting) subunit E [Finegoldia magna]|uniref:Putative NADH:ubiquinone oxidoreductase, E subunit n=1 Tax=Finegoldia magna ATCC 53516 TaxID=525282 RepID=D6S726_FINMA|nr:Rnf-Nqr domain containing protein [Finegoldia magna]EFH93880.1 putative NADH:ubiquinone oxidoreductase, E subunit [Finegoldia magna ATCC 53516]MBS5777546.1 NADH:ubiquinone reductase (Na(+)-transporting) subunit E [Finegoldia magna]MBS5942574.1 NADH:ubiquinone reductase (Na(+)-transporting) subunit E [Finegoldia magna]MBS5966304.1 NADH:ubiquinone reductase (Na(+)-transporting) subunit E [Finegoldia magna]MCA5587766.1 NADH:ubiquinone reductase (Na(+)-transporting) subunit E [Finegoldia magna]